MDNIKKRRSVILVVDDTPSNLEVLSELLEFEGYKVLIAKNGNAALKSVALSKPDLVLLDIMMPELDGFQTCISIKSNPAFDHIPIIFMTAQNDVDSKVKAFAVGAVDYITKPFQSLELIARVETHLTLSNLKKTLERQNAQLVAEQNRSEALLRNVLPAKVAQDLKQYGHTEPQELEHVSILFADIVGFTEFAAKLTPNALITKLNELFTGFDNIMDKNHCERIKTIGDAYLAVCGLSNPTDKHAYNLVNAAKEILSFMNAWNERRFGNERNKYWKLRIGIHSGSIIAGIVGIKKYMYDLFGHAMNLASRLEGLSEPMRINISEHTMKLVKDDFAFTEREPVSVKGEGVTKMYFVE